jgi:hypothetical protein
MSELPVTYLHVDHITQDMILRDEVSGETALVR